MKTQTGLALGICAGVIALSNSGLAAVNSNSQQPKSVNATTSQVDAGVPSYNTTARPEAPQSGAITTTDVAQKIRNDLTARKDLSPQAQNIAIVNDNGNIFLRGVVESEDEKRMIEDIAKKSAMNATVTNELTVPEAPQMETTEPSSDTPLDVE